MLSFWFQKLLDCSFQMKYNKIMEKVKFMSREKEFDKGKALHQAMLVFWRKGYNATSVPDLLQAMKLSRSSLYNTFCDKRTLYINALEHYKENRSYKLNILNSASSTREGIKQYFEQHISSMYDANSPEGCFVTNTAISMETPDEKLKQLIRANFINLEQSFYNLLKKGQLSGEIGKNIDIKAFACLLLNLNHSINIMAKVNINKQEIEQMINVVICSL